MKLSRKVTPPGPYVWDEGTVKIPYWAQWLSTSTANPLWKTSSSTTTSEELETTPMLLMSPTDQSTTLTTIDLSKEDYPTTPLSTNEQQEKMPDYVIMLISFVVVIAAIVLISATVLVMLKIAKKKSRVAIIETIEMRNLSDCSESL